MVFCLIEKEWVEDMVSVEEVVEEGTRAIRACDGSDTMWKLMNKKEADVVLLELFCITSVEAYCLYT